MFKQLNFTKQLKFFVGFLMIASVSFTACEELKEETNDQTVEITADAGTDMTAKVGEQVTLDGSNSTSTSGTIAYQWEMITKPNESTAELSNVTSAKPFFTPDVEGDYIVELTVSVEGTEDTDEIVVMASGAADNQTKEISGEINENTTWTDRVSDPAIPDYLVTGNVGINAQLTIEPGVLIHVKEDVGLWVNSEGIIISEGTSDNMIEFTSADEASSLYWKGIQVYSSSSKNKFEFTKIRYAGNSKFGFSGTNYATAIGIEEGKLSIMNSEISNSNSYGLFLHSGEISQFSENAFSDNKLYSIRINATQTGNLDSLTTFANNDNAVEIYGSTASSTSDIIWPDLSGEARYYVSGSINVDSYLKISPGAIFDFAEDQALNVTNNGVLVADASGNSQIIFTSKDAGTGIFWKGIYVNSNDSRNILANVEVSYAGNSAWGFSGTNYAAAIGIENAKLSISNTTISNSNNYGVYFHSGSFPQFSSNTFEGNANHSIVMMADEVRKIDENTTFTNNGWDGVTIYNSTMTEESSWVNLSGDAQYRVQGWVSVEEGLTINAGAQFAFDESIGMDVKNGGYLIAKGASDNKIIFTSSNEAGGINWAGIRIRTSDSRNEMDYVEVNLAGGYSWGFSGTNYSAAIAGDDGDSPQLSLTNSTVKNSASYAVFWEGGTINDVTSSAANNTFSNNAQDPAVVIP
jgi:hypothetical protein